MPNPTDLDEELRRRFAFVKGSSQRPALPPLFDEGGFGLAQAVTNNRFNGPSSGLFACLAILSAYTPLEGFVARIKGLLRATEAAVILGNGVLQPNVVRYSVNNRYTLYAVAGTTNVAQWWTLLFNVATRTCVGCPGQVYTSFADIADAGYGAVLTDALLRGKDKPISLVGHSLGGTLAEIWAHKLRQLDGFTDVGATSFGGPRFGTPDYAGQHVTGVDLERVVSEGDVVPNVLPTYYARSQVGDNGVNVNPLIRFAHKVRRVMLWSDAGYDRSWQEDGPVDRMLADLGSLLTGDVPALASKHGILTYGRRALRNSLLGSVGPRDPKWQRDAAGLIRGILNL